MRRLMRPGRPRASRLLPVLLLAWIIGSLKCLGFTRGPRRADMVKAHHDGKYGKERGGSWGCTGGKLVPGFLARVSPAALGLILGLRPLPMLYHPAGMPARGAEANTATLTKKDDRELADSKDDLFDEVWKLTSKFYLDRSFGGHDWEQVRRDLRPKVESPDLTSEVKATRAMLRLLGDKYTQLLPPTAYSEMSRFDPIGAGFMLSIDDDGYFCVSSDPREGTEAARQKIQKGDKILTIDGIAVKGKSVFDAVDIITKDDKANIRLTVQSHVDSSRRDVVLPRDFQAISNPVQYSLGYTSDKKPVGYVKLREFNSLAKVKIQEALADLRAQGAQEYVLDLRGNPGGSVQAAVSVAGLFLGEDQVVTYIQDATGNRLPLRTQGGAVLREDPLMVWTDKRSASASEILAAALHDNCRAVIMGQTTFGKGLVQGVFGLSDGQGLIMTVAKYETPRGASIQGTGIAPDIKTRVSVPFVGEQTVSMLRPEDFVIKSRDLCVDNGVQGTVASQVRASPQKAGASRGG